MDKKATNAKADAEKPGKQAGVQPLSDGNELSSAGDIIEKVIAGAAQTVTESAKLKIKDSGSSADTDANVRTYNFSNDSAPDGNITDTDMRIVEKLNELPFRSKAKYSAENTRRMNLLIAIFSVLTFMFLVVFIDAVIQFEKYFIVFADDSYQIDSGEFLTVNDAYDGYKETYTVNVSFEGGNVYETTAPMITVAELAERLYPGHTESGKIYEYNYPSDTLIENGMTVSINLIEYKTEHVKAKYPYSVINNEIQTIPKGTRIIKQLGVDGLVERELKEKYVNGVLADVFIMNTIVLEEPVNEIADLGVGGTFVNKRGNTIEYSYYVDVLATAYGVDTGWGGDNKYTYTGSIARYGVIAVDPDVIPFNSKVYLTGEGGDLNLKYGDMAQYFYAEDAGNAIIGNRIDIYMGDDLHKQTQFGKRMMRVYIIELPKEDD